MPIGQATDIQDEGNTDKKKNLKKLDFARKIRGKPDDEALSAQREYYGDEDTGQ